MENINLKNNMNSEFELDERAGDSIFNKVIRDNKAVTDFASLPDAIKKAMIENPIPQISLSETIDMDFVKGAKKLMEREGLVNPKKNPVQSSGQQTNTSDLISSLTPIIENVVRKVMDEKLNQILAAQQTQSVNENLVLKVGDSIFKGKITGVNKAK